MNPTKHSHDRSAGRLAYSGIPKRLLDLVAAAFLLVVTSPIMALAALAISLEGDGGVIFRQIRMGQGMKPFVCYKFRTMRPNAPGDCASAALENPERYITKVGRILRRFSIDELPQLVNVIKGDMSLVGPRPVILGERELIELRRQLGVYSVKPGITGLAQIRGRDNISIHRKAALDFQYTERLSLGYDIKLLGCTVLSVLGCRGVREGKAEPEEGKAADA